MSKHRILGGGIVELRQHIHPAGHTNVSEHVEPVESRELVVVEPEPWGKAESAEFVSNFVDAEGIDLSEGDAE